MRVHVIKKNYDYKIKESIDTFIKNHPKGIAFQSTSMFDIFLKTSNYKSVLIYAIDVEKNIIGVLLLATIKEFGVKSLFSKRTVIWGGPLVSDKIQNPDNVFEKLLVELNKTIGKKSIYTELRCFSDLNGYKSILLNQKFHHIDYLNVILNINESSLEKALAKMKYNRRREIKLSFKNNTKYYTADNLEDVEKVYNILFDLYKNKVKLPLPDFSFFENIFKSDIGKVFIVKHNNQVIGGSFCICSFESIYTWYYCGINNYHKKIFPTHLAIVAAIDYGIANNIPKLDLMGAGKPNVEYGVRNYKIQFGGNLLHTTRYIKINNRLLYYIGKIGLKLISKF